jgi:hypothetical protein
MRILIKYFLLGLLFVNSKSYSQLSFTISSPNGNYSITCFYTLVKLFAISAYTASPVSYSWTNSQAGSATGSSLAVNSPGIYSITATAGSLTASQTLAIGINTTAPTLTVTASASVIACITGSVQLLALSNATTNSFTWTAPFISPGMFTNTFVAFSPGTYTAYVQDSNNGCISKATITIGDDRNYPVLSQSGPFTVSCPNGTMNINAVLTGTKSNYIFQWYSTIGAIPGATNSTLPNSPPDIYKVTVTDPQNGCTSQSIIEVWACTGIESENQEGKRIVMFPNPVRDQLYLINPMFESIVVSIQNSLGQIVFKEQFLDAKNEMDMSRFGGGIYFLITQSGSGQKTFKFLKQ